MESIVRVAPRNHPAGDLKPSVADIEVTLQIKRAGEIMGIQLLDHIIFNRNGYFSFLESGKL
jgi:DNA repair protein RadC